MTPEDISSALEKDLLNGAYPPGTALPQGDLAARFGVSRIPVRDALAQLAIAGLVELAPNRRARVIQMSDADITEAYDLRILLECDLLERAILNMTNRDLHQIDYALDRSNLEARSANWAAGDALFHTTLYSPARRSRHMAMIDTIRRACCVQIAAYDTLPEVTDRWLADHAALRDYCRARQPRRAVQRLKAHLQGAKQAVLRHRSL